MTVSRRRPNIYQHRQRHRLAALFIGMPLFIVALTGCVLALKAPITASGILGARDPWPFIYDLHRGLVAGWPGRVLISVAGLGLWLMVVSGLKSLVRLKGRKPSRHAVIGMVLGIPIAVVASIGAVLNFVEPLSNWLDPIPVTETIHVAGAYQLNEAEMSSARLAAAAVRNDADPLKIYQPKVGRPYLIFYYEDNTRIYIEPKTSQVLKVRSSWSHWTGALLPLHSLRPLGLSGIALMLLFGLSLAWLTGRGLAALIRAWVTPVT
ncbi:MAG: PepSY domain-containing protein [Deltaproteobacteria bacterium]|nr:PepSY domain-containing protein [Deltaproteobacteria bacterium]